MSRKRNVTVSAVQMKCSTNVEENIAKADALVREAAEKGAQIILLPELFERQYFCQERRYEYYEFAKKVNENDAVKHFSALAKELSVVIPVSFYEKDVNRLFNTVAVIDADGSNLGIYRKTHIPDDRHRVAEVVQRLHAVYVHAHALLAQKGGQLRVAPAPLVAGHIKGHHTHLPEPLQRFVNGRAALVQPEPCTVLTHLFFPPSLVPRQTKKRRCRTKKCRPALGKKPFFARRKPPDKMCRSHGPRFSMIQKDGMMRVYIAILLLLLFIDRFTLTVSQVCALAAQFHGCKGTNL